MSRTWIIFVILLAAACTADPATTPTPVFESGSAWGKIFTITQTEQANAPAMAVHRGFLAFAWVGSDEVGVHQDVRLLNSDGFSPVATLPLSPIRPDRLQVVAGSEQNTLLFYLDANEEGETRLYSSLFGEDSTLRFGPTLISNLRTDRYTITPNADGTFWVIWSGGALGERALYVQYLDALGRPRPAERLISDADYPTVLDRADGTRWLYWLSASSRQLYRAQWANGVLSRITPLTAKITLQKGERLVNFVAAHDLTTTYVFWNTVDAEGSPHSWLVAGDSAPALMTIGNITDTEIQTGFNGGAAYEVTVGENALAWVVPLVGQSELLLAAAQFGDQLGVVFLQAGQPTAFQPVITLETSLIGLPAFATDINRHLYLAWSQPQSTGDADLLLTSTRSFE